VIRSIVADAKIAESARSLGACRAPVRRTFSTAVTVLQKPIEFPLAEPDRGFGSELISAVATANSLSAAMKRLVERVRREAGAAAVEWWGATERGALTRIVTSGPALGRRESVPLGRAGELVIYGGDLGREARSALGVVAAVIRRRANEEELARAAGRLARRNEELDEFAALVAHELKTPLHAALSGQDPAESIGQALDLVDMLLQAAQTGPVGHANTDAAEPLERAIASLGGAITVTSELSVTLPVPSVPLFVVLRNLLSNAVSAGASRVHVRTARAHRCLVLSVEDDGAGLADPERYLTGSSIGLSLCRQIAARSGGVVELSGRIPHGSCATLTFGLAAA
jgi:signal transduction histidine kinase